MAFHDEAIKTGTEGTLLLDIALDNKHLYLSDKYITVTYEHEGAVADWGSMDLSSGSNGISEVSDWSITLFNKRLMHMTTDERISDMLDSYNWEGRKATIRQYFTGLTYSGCQVEMSGRITNVSFDDTYFYFDIVDAEEIFREVPINRISKQEFANAPQSSIGLGKPIVYGVPYSRSSMDTLNWTLWPTILVNEITGQYLCADHVVGQVNFPNVGVGVTGSLFMYIEEIDSYLYCSDWTNTSYSNTASGALLTLNYGVEWTLFMRPKIRGTQYDVVDTDFSNAVDEDDTTSFTIPAEKNFYISCGNLVDLGPIEDANIKLIITYSAATGTDPYGVVKYYNPQYDNATGAFSTGENVTAAEIAGGTTWTLDKTAHGSRDDQGDADDQWNWTELASYEFGLTTGAGDTISIQEIYLQISGLTFGYIKRLLDRSKVKHSNKRG